MNDYEIEAMKHREQLANISLHIGATKLSPQKPFQWASGFFMPIYNDNRMLLSDASYRSLICTGLANQLLIEGYDPDVIAGTATAGIPHATSLADKLNKQLIYIRDKPKDHGMKNQIEGISADSDLQGKKVLVIEDLVSTGGSSAKAVDAVRKANGTVDYCFSIFNYGLNEAAQMFAGERTFDPKDPAQPKLDPPCKLRSILHYDTLIVVAHGKGTMTAEQTDMLKEWRDDPFKWGEKHGFPPVKK